MDCATLYKMFSDAVDSGKITVLKAFLDTLRTYPALAILFTWLLLRKPMKTITEFIKYFI